MSCSTRLMRGGAALAGARRLGLLVLLALAAGPRR
jgi:hypothetical protein